MTNCRTQADVLNKDFLETRGKLLELAAALDRLDRAEGSGTAPPDPRRGKLGEGLDVLRSVKSNRAEAIQKIFSLDYDPEWQKRFEL